MWGQGYPVEAMRSSQRIIPTRVGTRVFLQKFPIGTGDHPHACGDKWLSKYGKDMYWGSSPRVWGQDGRDFIRLHQPGIIPTRVGTRTRIKRYIKKVRDHPHACGDKTECLLFCRTVKGSSPRVWGQVVSAKFNAKRNGIIPTRVGTSQLERLSTTRHQDHPHACGDKTLIFPRPVKIWGSSPRVWGQVTNKYYTNPFARIIPTRVGTRYLHK